MASKLHALQSKVAEASKSVARHGCSYYKQVIKQNKQYIQEPPTVVKCQLLANQLVYTRLASIPARYEAFWKELDCLQQMMKKRPEMMLQNASTAVLFGVECFAWFWAGEIVGRGFTIFGYSV